MDFVPRTELNEYGYCEFGSVTGRRLDCILEVRSRSRAVLNAEFLPS